MQDNSLLSIDITSTETIEILGFASLAGTLEIVIDQVITEPTSFVIMNFSRSSGDFATVNATGPKCQRVNVQRVKMEHSYEVILTMNYTQGDLHPVGQIPFNTA